MEQNFKDFKEIILIRAREARPCRAEYQAAYQSKTLIELMVVLRKNFKFAVDNNVIDRNTVWKYKELFDECSLFCEKCALYGFPLDCCHDLPNTKPQIISYKEIRELISEYCKEKYGYKSGGYFFYLDAMEDGVKRKVIKVLPRRNPLASKEQEKQGDESPCHGNNCVKNT